MKKIMDGYKRFREKYALESKELLSKLATQGQAPEVMVVACSDSRVDPAVLLQCEPGDLFVIRNVANIVPPYEIDGAHHGTSAALEFGICYLKVKHLIILGHSQCGGINALLNPHELKQNDFITNWVDVLGEPNFCHELEECAQASLLNSYQHCLTFPWIKEHLDKGELQIHLWYFSIAEGVIHAYNEHQQKFLPLL